MDPNHKIDLEKPANNNSHQIEKEREVAIAHQRCVIREYVSLLSSPSLLSAPFCYNIQH